MGSLMRLRILLLCSLLLGGCAAAAAVAAVPGVLVDRTMGYFKGQDISLALDMQRSLAAVQQGLERMSLHVNVLEPVPVEAKVAATFCAIIPDLPMPSTTRRPSNCRIACTARQKSPFKAAATASMAEASMRSTARASSNHCASIACPVSCIINPRSTCLRRLS